jgi:hypothetical protein
MGHTPFAERRDQSGGWRREAPVIEAMTAGYRKTQATEILWLFSKKRSYTRLHSQISGA